MTCDDVLPALEIGDAVRGDAARRHAQDCPACAAAVTRWLAVKTSLGATPTLSDVDRAAWRDARREVVARPRPRRHWLVGAAAVAASVAVALAWPRPAPDPQVAPAAPLEVLAYSPERAAEEYADFDRRLDQLDGELATLPDRIALADARRTAAELTAQYRQ